MKNTQTIVTGAIAALAGFGGGSVWDRTVQVTPQEVGAMVTSLDNTQKDAADAVLLRRALADCSAKQKELASVLDTYRTAQPTIANLRGDIEACEEAVRHHAESARRAEANYSALLMRLSKDQDAQFDTNELPGK